MTCIDRRALLLRTAVAGAMFPVAARASWWTDSRDFVFGGAGGLLPGGLAVLGGFGLVKAINLFSDADQLVKGPVSDLVSQTSVLERHIDGVVTQISAELSNIDKFVQGCEADLRKLTSLVQDLPAEMARVYNEAQLRANVGKLKGHRSSMAGYLNSIGSISTNHRQIQTLCDNIVNDISVLSTTDTNLVEFCAYALPGASTWMQGYTAYNLLEKPGNRGASPWDHALIKSTVVPMANSLVSNIKSQIDKNEEVFASLPIEEGVLFKMNGERFSRTSIPFKTQYVAGELEQNQWYICVWPNGVAPPPAGPIGDPIQPGLFAAIIVMPPPAPNPVWFRTGGDLAIPGSPAAKAWNNLSVQLSSYVRGVNAFEKLTEGWPDFEKGVQGYLVTGDRDGWAKMPQVKIPA